MEAFKRILHEHPFFKVFTEEHLDLIQGCASNVKFEPGEFIYREGGDANQFYLLRHGRVSVEIFAIGRGAVTIETLSEGDLLGWSWLMPPYKWHMDARALEQVRAIVLDGECLRRKCETDPAFGYIVIKQVADIISRRLQATRLHLLDIYGHHS